VNGSHQKRVFRPTLIPGLLTAILMICLISLGNWQLQRSAYKKDLAASFAAAGGTIEQLVEGREYAEHTQLQVSGEYLVSNQILIDNMVLNGLAGYFVITPLQISPGKPVLLVNRGWIEHPQDPNTLPALDIADAVTTISGRVGHLPQPGMRLAGETVALTGDWPRIAVFPQQQDLARALQLEVIPFVLLLDAGAKDGLAREWAPAEFGPERHLAYAVQWFALALTLGVIFIVMNLKTVTEK
jgi:surfeit locus 1 family protein